MVNATAQAWYLYGITRPPESSRPLGLADPVQLLAWADLAAIVKPVAAADFSPAVLETQLRNAAELEALVRSHNQVIESIHARQAILPAKFGSVYAQPEDIVCALRAEQETLLSQLERLEGCDEWAVHVHASRRVVREQISAADAGVRRLREQLAVSGPGRAYFLEQAIRDEVERTTREALLTVAQTAFERLADHAVNALANPIRRVADSVDEIEILRGAFLVTRDRTDEFAEQVQSIPALIDRLRCESTGPWPPYSFA